MFKWPGVPSVRAPEHEVADFAELVGWRKKSMSTTFLSKLLGRNSENDYSRGVPEEEETDAVVQSAYMEIERRKDACGDGYPFEITGRGYTLRADRSAGGNPKHIIYKYLLLATRLNMQSNRVHADIDGALLFEELAAESGREYLGPRAESLVFGTAAGSVDFSEKVNELCRKMKEGGGFKCHGSAPSNQRDGKLDVVVWKPFADKSAGKLIAFGQCKTGTNYKDSLTQLQPDSFCRKWLRSSPAVPPMRAFFVSEALSRSQWYNNASDAGLLFDRCRIVEFCDDISEDVLKRVKNWTLAAAKSTVLQV